MSQHTIKCVCVFLCNSFLGLSKYLNIDNLCFFCHHCVPVVSYRVNHRVKYKHNQNVLGNKCLHYIHF